MHGLVAAVLKTLGVCLLLLTSTSCHLLWKWRGPCSFWPMPDPAASGERFPQTFTSAEGRFRIGLPGRNDRPAADRTFNWFVFNLGDYHVSYHDGAQVLDTPELSETVLNRIRDAALSKRPGQLELDSAISLSGHPGREVRIRNEKGIQVDRIYLSGSRVYIVSVFVPKSLDCKLGSAVKVLDTFEITE